MRPAASGCHQGGCSPHPTGVFWSRDRNGLERFEEDLTMVELVAIGVIALLAAVVLAVASGLEKL